jgi:hypothetical protein
MKNTILSVAAVIFFVITTVSTTVYAVQQTNYFIMLGVSACFLLLESICTLSLMLSKKHKTL